MNTYDEVFEFLRAHQPMSEQDEADDLTLAKLDEARRYSMQHPTEALIPYWLGVFGKGNGEGIYQLVEDVCAAFSADVLEPYIAQALASRHESVRYWAAQIAARFPSARLTTPLEKALVDGTVGVREAVVTALEAVATEETEESTAVLRRWLPHEDDPTLAETLNEILQYRG